MSAQAQSRPAHNLQMVSTALELTHFKIILPKVQPIFL